MDPKILINGVKIAAVAALATPLVLDLGCYFPFVGPKSLYFIGLSQTIFFLWLALAVKCSQYRPNLKNPVVAAMLFFLAVSFASAVFGADYSASFWSKFERMDGLLMLFSLTAFAIAISSVFDKTDWRRFFYASISIALVVALEAIFDTSSSSRGGGYIGNDSFWGMYVLFNIFLALYLFVSEWRVQAKWAKIIAGIIFFGLVSCLLLEGCATWRLAIGVDVPPATNFLLDIFNTGARAAKISFFAGLVLIGILRLATLKNAAAKALGLLVLSGAFVGAISVAIYVSGHGSSVYETLVSRFGEGTVRGRIVVWEIAWKGFLERPFLGWGPENFNLVFARHYNPCMEASECSGEIWYDRAHNIIFDSLVDGGILGLAGYLALFIAALFVLWKAFFAGKAEFASASIFTALFAAYFLQNLTVFDMVVSYLMCFACLGFAAHVYGRQEPNKLICRPLGTWVAVALIIAGLVCFNNFVWRPFSTDRLAVRAVSARDIPQKLDLSKETLETSPMGRYQIRLFFSHSWLQLMGDKEFVASISQPQAELVYSYLANELEKSCRESPLDFQSRLELGRLYSSWAIFDKSKTALAENTLNEAMKMSPQNQQTYWELAQNRLYEAKFDEAIGFAQKAYDLYPGVPRAKTILDQIKKFKAQTDDAAKNAL